MIPDDGPAFLELLGEVAEVYGRDKLTPRAARTGTPSRVRASGASPPRTGRTGTLFLRCATPPRESPSM